MLCVVRYSMFDVRCLSFVVCVFVMALVVVRFRLPLAFVMLLVECCLMFIVICLFLFFVVCGFVCDVCCLLFVVSCLRFVVRCALLVVGCCMVCRRVMLVV